MPSIMMLAGRIAPGSALNPVTPAHDDQVLVFSSADGQLVGSGPVSQDGEYAAILMRTTSFNGTAVVLELQHGRQRFQLLRDGAPAWLKYRGRLLPERTALDLRIGARTAELSAELAANPQAQRLSQRPDIPCAAELDVNEDGKCDEADWAIIGLYAGGVTHSVANPGSGE